MFKPMLLMVMLLAISSCKPAGAVQQRETPSQDTIPLAVFEKGACFGFCPVFSIAVYPDGQARYMGVQYVEQEGEVRFQLDASELRALRAALEEANLWEQPEQFPTQIADAPFSTWQVFGPGGATRRVAGNMDRPDALLRLDRLMISIGQAHGLELTQGVSPHEPRRAYRKELIVLLEEGVNPGNWMMQFEPLRLQLVRRLGTPNRWIIAYDEGEISGKDLQERLRKAPGVLGVDLNAPAQERH